MYAMKCVSIFLSYIVMTGMLQAAEPVLWQRGNLPRPEPFNISFNTRVGTIDAAGNFVPDRNGPLRSRPTGSGPTPLLLITNQSGGWVDGYEHRAGTLIPGRNGGWQFVPEIGSKVLDLKSRSGPGKVDRVVYNRAASVADFWTLERRVQYPNGIPQVTPFPAVRVPAGWKLVQFGRAYPRLFSTTEPWFVRVIGDTSEYGHLDADGEFVPDYGLPVMARSAAPPPAESSDLPDGVWYFTFTLPRKGLKREPVHEFRSGRLLTGILDDTGNFTPELGSTVRDFEDYKPGVGLRIYNLPGVLIPVDNK